MASPARSRDALSPACHLAAGSVQAQVNVLGPVELVLDGRVVSVRSSRTRRLLAMLALACDQVVSSDRLIDAVWREDLPADPVAALQSQISRLRAVLGPAATGLETTSGGYRLRSDAIAVDLTAFDATAALACSEGDPVRRVELLSQAIAMVRGAAYEDLEVDDASRR